jgi:ABC-type anion transport system duplicated permease subunit
MACNNSGVWNEAGTFLDFAVAPAYYQTRWFQLSRVAAFMVLLWVLYRMRLRQVARQFNLRLEERVNERTRIARVCTIRCCKVFMDCCCGFRRHLNRSRCVRPKRNKHSIAPSSRPRSDYRGAGCGTGVALIDGGDQRPRVGDKHFGRRIAVLWTTRRT